MAAPKRIEARASASQSRASISLSGTSLRMTGDVGTGKGTGEKVMGARIGEGQIAVSIVGPSGLALKLGGLERMLVFRACTSGSRS